jgi:hypothetical protein
MSGISDPTEGYADIYGRVDSYVGKCDLNRRNGGTGDATGTYPLGYGIAITLIT